MKNFLKISIIILTLTVMMFSAGITLAEPYILLEPIGELTQVDTSQPFAQYVGGLLKFLVGFAAISAVVMIVVWGIIYASSTGKEATISNAKEGITAAILGLILALMSVLILFTINPDLVNLKITIPDLPTSGLGSGGQFACPSGQNNLFCNAGDTCQNNGNNNFTCLPNTQRNCINSGNVGDSLIDGTCIGPPGSTPGNRLPNGCIIGQAQCN